MKNVTFEGETVKVDGETVGKIIHGFLVGDKGKHFHADIDLRFNLFSAQNKAEYVNWATREEAEEDVMCTVLCMEDEGMM